MAAREVEVGGEDPKEDRKHLVDGEGALLLEADPLQLLQLQQLLGEGGDQVVAEHEDLKQPQLLDLGGKGPEQVAAYLEFPQLLHLGDHSREHREGAFVELERGEFELGEGRGQGDLLVAGEVEALEVEEPVEVAGQPLQLVFLQVQHLQALQLAEVGPQLLQQVARQSQRGDVLDGGEGLEGLDPAILQLYVDDAGEGDPAEGGDWEVIVLEIELVELPAVVELGRDGGDLVLLDEQLLQLSQLLEADADLPEAVLGHVEQLEVREQLQLLGEALKLVEVELEQPQLEQAAYLGWDGPEGVVVGVDLAQVGEVGKDEGKLLDAVAVEADDLEAPELLEIFGELLDLVLADAEDFEGEGAEGGGEGGEVVAEAVDRLHLLEFGQGVDVGQLVEVHVYQLQVYQLRGDKVQVGQAVVRYLQLLHPPLRLARVPQQLREHRRVEGDFVDLVEGEGLPLEAVAISDVEGFDVGHECPLEGEGSEGLGLLPTILVDHILLQEFDPLLLRLQLVPQLKGPVVLHKEQVQLLPNLDHLEHVDLPLSTLDLDAHPQLGDDLATLGEEALLDVLVVDQLVNQVLVLPGHDLAETALVVPAYFALLVREQEVIARVGLAALAADEGGVDKALALVVGAEDEAGVLELAHVEVEVFPVHQLLVHRGPQVVVRPNVAHLRYRPELRPLDLVYEVGEFVRAGLEPRLGLGRLDLRKGSPTFSWI